MDKLKECFSCHENKPTTEFGSNGNGRLKPRCKPCNYDHEQSIFMEKIYKAIGGEEYAKCALCEYNRYFGALEFHHTDPNEKDFVVSRMVNYSYNKIKEEVDKCVILCGNCHPEVHAGIRHI